MTGDGRSGPPVSGSWPSTSAVWPQPVCPPQVRAMRLSFVGELGWELHIPRPSCVPVYRAVMAAGAKHGLVPAGYRAIDNLSIEKGGHGVQAALVGLPVPPTLPSPDTVHFLEPLAACEPGLARCWDLHPLHSRGRLARH